MLLMLNSFPYSLSRRIIFYLSRWLIVIIRRTALVINAMGCAYEQSGRFKSDIGGLCWILYQKMLATQKTKRPSQPHCNTDKPNTPPTLC